MQEVLNSYQTDATTTELLTTSQSRRSGLFLGSCLIKYNGCLWIGNNSALQSNLISAFHGSAGGGGRYGVRVMYQRLSKLLSCHGMKKHVEEFQVCQQARHERAVLVGLLQPLPIPTRP